MNNKIKQKKYFLKDTEISSIDEDKFNQRDVVNNISLIIENTNSPYNIALIGKCGIGKSSIINLLLDKYKNNNENYIVQKINAWKCENEPLNSIFAKELCANTNMKNVKKSTNLKKVYDLIINDNEDNLNKKKKKSKPIKSLFKTIFQIILIFIIALLITIPLFALYKYMQNILLDAEITQNFVKDMYASYFENIKTIIAFPIIISFAIMFLKQFSSKNTNFEINVNSNNYENYKTNINDAIKEIVNYNENKKIITVIDDLDKLTTNNIVEALDIIKSFDGLKNCIFIVPFDEKIMKKALDFKKVTKTDKNNKMLETTYILDKLFQYKVYVPALLDSDVKQYAIDIVNENIPSFIAEYCKMDIMENVIKKVLIHKGVTTPRQVKKIINNFVNNKILITKRIQNGKIEKDLLNNEEFDYKLAKISVLQSDFSEFYNVLFKNFNYINKIIEIHDKGIKYSDINEDLVMFFKPKCNNKNDKSEIRKEYEPLINFLKNTEKYKIDNLGPFMYWTQDEVSVKLGGENNRRIISAMESNNSTTVRNIIMENPDIVESMVYELENVKDSELLNCISTAINSFDAIPETSKELKQLLADIISEKLHSVGYFKNDCDICCDFNIKNLYKILILSENNENIKIALSNNAEYIINEVFENNGSLVFFRNMVNYFNNEATEKIFSKLLCVSKYSELKNTNNPISQNTEELELENAEYNGNGDFTEIVDYKELQKQKYTRFEEIFKVVCIEENKENIRKFIEDIIENYNMNYSNKEFFIHINQYVQISKKYLNSKIYLRYLKIVAVNFENYPEEAIELFKSLKSHIPDVIMNIIFGKLTNCVNEENYEDIFYILKNNSDCLFESTDTISLYVQFLVNNIKLSSNPDEIIEELDDNFNRISKVYELNKSIQELQGSINYEQAYAFLAKCIDNGSTDRMIIDFNKILSDKDSYDICLKIESKMEKYNLKDVIEYDVDVLEDMSNLTTKEDIEYAEYINNINILKNLVNICVNKQESIEASDVLKILQNIFKKNLTDEEILEIYKQLNNFDRMYFYEIRRDFNEMIYNCFHISNSNNVKLALLECARYFKITRLFKNKLSGDELEFYNKNS